MEPELFANWPGARQMTLLAAGMWVTLFSAALPAADGLSPHDDALRQITQPQAAQNYGNLPMSFEANAGQTDSSVKFLSRGRGYTLLLNSTEAVLFLRRPAEDESGGGTESPRQSSEHHAARARTPARSQSSLRMRLAGANSNPQVEGFDKLPGIANYFVGDDPKAWRTGVATYAKVKYGEVYRGVDLIYYGNQQQLEYDFVVSPGADPKCITLDFEGADKLDIDSQGELIVQMEGGSIRWHKPVAYQAIDGVKREIPSAYVLKNKNQIGFQVASYNRSQPLVIDPVLIYSTFLGGSDFDVAEAIAVDGNGNVYVTGETISTNFPTLNAYRATPAGANDAFVTKLNSAGTALVYSTYLGGSGDEFSRGIAVDNSGNVYVTGDTLSINFPRQNEFQSTSDAGYGNAFLSKLGPSGSTLLYSTYFGGLDTEFGTAVAADNSGNAYVTGATFSDAGFPTKNPFQMRAGGSPPPGNFASLDAFVAKFNTAASGSASLVYSSWLGGTMAERGTAIAVDASGSAYVAGIVFWNFTDDVDFPTLNPFQAAYAGGGSDGFVTKINSAGSLMVFSTYLGAEDDDSAFGIALDASNNVHVVGQSFSTNFPVTAGALQPVNTGAEIYFSGDAFVTKLNSTGASLLYSTYLGGELSDFGNGIAVDRDGYVYVAGQTLSDFFPVTVDTYQPTNGGDPGPYDVFVAKIAPAVPGPSGLVFSTFLGGPRNDLARGIAIDTNGNFYVAGQTSSTNFPTTAGAYVTSYRGGSSDSFVAKFASQPDISVSKVVSTNSVIVGSNLTYTIKVNNNGRLPFSNVTLTDDLPPNLQLISSNTTMGIITVTGNVVTCQFGSLPSNAAATVTLNVHTVTAGTITNAAVLTSAETQAGQELNTGNNTGRAITVIRGIADVTIAVSDAPDPVTVTSNLTYTIGVTNKGPDTATSIVVTDALPASVTIVSASSTQGTCFTNDPGFVICDVGSLTNGGGAAFTIVVRTTIGTTITNLAGVSALEVDSTPANNTATTITTVIGSADLSISQSSAPNPVLAGNNLTYTIIVTNRGFTTAASVTVTDTLPASVTFISANSTQGTCSTNTPGIVTCNLGSMANGATATVTIVVRPNIGGSITNNAGVGSSVADPNTGNNTASAVTTVTASADLSVSQTGSPNPVSITSNLTYTITVTNKGPSTATGTVLTNTLPSNVTFVSAQSSQGACVQSAGVVTCNFGDLAGSATATVTINVTPSLEGTIINRASVTSGVADPITNNNSASATNTVNNTTGSYLLKIARSTTNAVLYWSTNAAGFVLQSTTNLFSAATWTSVTNVPVIIGNQYFVTNSIGGSSKYYRLFSNSTQPILTARGAGTDVVISWTTNAPGYSLLSATNVGTTNVSWTMVTNVPVVVGGQYTVTNAVSGSGTFYRLIK